MKAMPTQRLLVIAAISAALLLFGALAVGGLSENLVYFWDVDQLLAKQEQAKRAT